MGPHGNSRLAPRVLPGAGRHRETEKNRVRRTSKLMPHHKSAAKRLRTSEKARQRNRVVKSKLKKTLKKVEAATPEESAEALRHAESALDRAAKKRVIHPRQADRRKSRLARRANAQAAATG